MQLPGRFNCTYVDSDGTKKTPVMIHRACFGSLERFIGIILENTAGNFPLWLTPVQIQLLPVNASIHLEFAKKLKEKFEEHKFRVEIDETEEKLGYKMRQAQLKKVPYILVIGDNEMNNNTVSYRKHGESEAITVSIDEFIIKLEEEIKSMK